MAEAFPDEHLDPGEFIFICLKRLELQQFVPPPPSGG
jgi:hypothetical protein